MMLILIVMIMKVSQCDYDEGYLKYMGQCPAKSPFWSFNFITIKYVRYTKQHIFTTVLYCLFKFRTLVHTSVLSVQTDFGALDNFHAMVIKVSNPMG